MREVLQAIRELLQIVQCLSPSELREFTKEIIAESIKEIISSELEKRAITQAKLAYSKKEFAALIGKSESFIDRKRREGELEWKMNGGTVSIPASELDKFV